MLVDIYELGQHIRKGNIDQAVALSRKLAQYRVSLEATSVQQLDEEPVIQYVTKL